MHALGERVVAVHVLPTAAAPAKPKRRKSKRVWDEAAELLPDNEFAASITGLLRDVKAQHANA